MTISRFELQGQVARTQDFTTIKHNENYKGLVDQSNFQKEFHQNVENKVRQVRQGDHTQNEGKRFDAKEKGNGIYFGDGGKKRKKGEPESDGKVLFKGHGGFDMKI